MLNMSQMHRLSQARRLTSTLSSAHTLAYCLPFPLFPKGILALVAEVGGAGEVWDRAKGLGRVSE